MMQQIHTPIARPNSLRIGPFTYKLIWCDSARYEDEGESFGECVSNDQIIRLSRNRKRQRVAVSFKHEVDHALWFVYGNGQDKAAEEAWITAESTGWCAFIRDNPDAVAWLSDLLLHEPDKIFDSTVDEVAQ